MGSTGRPLRLHGGPFDRDETVPVLTHSDIDAMHRDAPSSPRPPDAKVPTWFPGVARAADAERVTVSAGQERSRVDFVMLVAPTATVRGTIALPAGVTSARTILQLFTPGADPGFASELPAPARRR